MSYSLGIQNIYMFQDMNHISLISLVFLKRPGFQSQKYGMTTIWQAGQMPGVSRLNIKTLLYWFFMILGCSPRVKIVELFDDCV